MQPKPGCTAQHTEVLNLFRALTAWAAPGSCKYFGQMGFVTCVTPGDGLILAVAFACFRGWLGLGCRCRSFFRCRRLLRRRLGRWRLASDGCGRLGIARGVERVVPFALEKAGETSCSYIEHRHAIAAGQFLEGLEVGLGILLCIWHAAPREQRPRMRTGIAAIVRPQRDGEVLHR